MKNILLKGCILFLMLIALLFITIKVNNWYNPEKGLSGTLEAEQYKHFFINQKTNEIQAIYFSAGGKFLRIGTITKDGYPKSQLDVFLDADCELMGYLQNLPDQEDQGSENEEDNYKKDTALMIKNNEYDEPREIYRSGRSILEWAWVDKKHVDVFHNCGTGCQTYHRINVDTKEIEHEGTIFSESG